jgi:hypothetical protein
MNHHQALLPLKPIAIAATLFASIACHQASAAEFDTGIDNLALRWDNTIKYSTAFRLRNPASALINDAPGNNINNLNLDDGDRNFSRGLISNRVDLLTELDISYKKQYGMRVTGAAWYDGVYNRSNDNDSPGRVNQSSVAYNQFTKATRNLHGRKAEFLDAFVYANNEDGNLRLGRHSLLYGETLFFGANGIANAQAPVDYVKLLSVPGSQFKEIILPVNQISGQYKLADGLTAGGYYQFEFRKSRIPAVGSYFSTVDVFDDGGENFLFAPGFGVPRIADLKAKDSGQFGLQLRWRPTSVDVEFGFYAARYHDKLFQPILRALPVLTGGAVAGPMNYQLAYPENIKTFGASFSKVIGDINVAGEVSVRRDTPLVGGAIIDMNPAGSGINSTAAYPVGNSAHANISAVAFFSGSSMPWNNASLLAEAGWNRATSITKNADAVDPTTARDAWGYRFIFEPTWFQVAPGLDLSAPIGVGYNPKGNSRVVQLFNGGVNKGGDLSVGLKGVYQQVWKFGLNYTHYMGSKGGALGADTFLTFKQTLADRDFVSLSVQRTF